MGGGSDQFWWPGDWRIDRVKQVDFVAGRGRGVLPISKRSQDLVRDILPVTKVGDATIRAKSGVLGAELAKPSLGWMVRCAEKACTQTVFALNMVLREPRPIANPIYLTHHCPPITIAT